MAGRRLTWLVAAGVALVVAAGCGLGGAKSDDRAGAPVSVVTDEPSDEASSAPVTESTPAPVVTSKAPAKPKPKPAKATPSEDPNNFEAAACSDHKGKLVSKSQAKAALAAAAAKIYWPGSAPTLKLNTDLVKNVAWHESGWQSDIINCDGGYGLMQVMPETEGFINDRFTQSYDRDDYKQNAIIGANYLAWETRYFGDAFFKKSYDLSPKKCASHTSMCLLNMVIAGYNAGHAAVWDAYPSKKLPNPGYVDSVRSLMESCFCDRY